MARKAKPATAKTVEALRYRREEATRKNIPTAEYQSVLDKEAQDPVRVAYQRRNRDLDPQLVWRGKDEQDWSDLAVQAPPLYIQEKVQPKALIDDLLRRTREKASLAEREGLRGKVQCIYIDPPYGIKFNSNFQWSTTSRDVKDGNAAHITREPEQVKAFRDTWRDGIHSYLTYLRDRLTVARDLLTESGSIFVQIGDENVHRVRAVMDEVFGEDNFLGQITVQKTTSSTNVTLLQVTDFLLSYARTLEAVKYRPVYRPKGHVEGGAEHYGLVQDLEGFIRPATEDERNGTEPLADGSDFLTPDNLQSAGMGRDKGEGAASWFPVDRYRWRPGSPLRR
jgi:adenine-specific DNA-methyltransferase